MFNSIIKKQAIASAQKFIDKLHPKVHILLHEELPLPSIKVIKKLAGTVAKINALEETTSALSDDQLRAKTAEFKSKYPTAVKKEKEELDLLEEEYKRASGQEEKDAVTIRIERAAEDLYQTKQKFLNAILPEAFAVVREVGKRVLNMRHFDVQLIGGIVLHNGNITEMTTGEGKTLVATLPAYLNALTGEGVHVVTVNDYLARRDRDWMGPLYEFLGLSIGVIQSDVDHMTRQEEYGRDITYGTNNEFGFDYLRDNMVVSKDEMVQPPHHFAIVDEVDSILVDEARTPLIISGPAEESTDKYYKANEIVSKLKGRRVTEKDEINAKYSGENLSEGYDYLADEKARSVSLTDEGEEKASRLFGVESLHDMETIEYRHHMLQAIKAHQFFKKDVDYVVRDGEVIIVDEFTGRMMPGRRWSDGLHQAVEAKERIKIARENQTLATITFQNYFRLYDKLSGMTGTAYTEATEFKEIYSLDCVCIPTNKKLRRTNYADSIYRSQREKYQAVIEEIVERHNAGQPVLVGTISIEKSELLSTMLKQKAIEHKVLNAKYHELEAHIIAQAGRYKGVTIATNMAGRGTDIVLGGNAEYLAKNLAEEKTGKDEDPQAKEDLTNKFIEQFRQQVKEEHERVVEAGGLLVIGTERHESRRIDNQLRGRQGRQGDPGASRFFVSLEDDLMRLFASDKIIGVMDKLGMEDGQVLEHPWLSKAIENAQRRVEGNNFEIRKHLLEYDNVMNRQREVIYNLRRTVLESTDMKGLIMEAVEDSVNGAVTQYLFSGGEEMSFDVEGLDNYLKTTFHYALGSSKEKFQEIGQEAIQALILEDLKGLYAQKEEAMGAEPLRHIERMLLMQTLDAKWKDHLYGMDQLKEGVGLRSFAQRDPLIEYKREGFEMFQAMYASIHQEVAELIFRIQQAGPSQRFKSVFNSVPQQFVHNEVSGLSQPPQSPSMGPQSPGGGPQPEGSAPVRKSGPKVGRNEPCPCGSGKKYKKCCGQ